MSRLPQKSEPGELCSRTWQLRGSGDLGKCLSLEPPALNPSASLTVNVLLWKNPCGILLVQDFPSGALQQPNSSARSEGSCSLPVQSPALWFSKPHGLGWKDLFYRSRSRFLAGLVSQGLNC